MPRAIARSRTYPTRNYPRPSTLARNGGCDFAADPELRGNEAGVVWLPKYNPRLALITAAAPYSVNGPSLASANILAARTAPEGTYVELTELPSTNTALLVNIINDDAPVALVLPLDDLLDDRIDMARRIYRVLVRRARLPPDGFTAQRRRRLKLVLRALDADLAGHGYRAIAGGLFGGRVPDGAEWRTHSVRSLTIRLVQEGRLLMRGGYLRLLRPDRRKR